jgi:hypothetical protein
MIVHVDGDVIVYRAGYAAEHTLYHVHYRGEDGAQATISFDGANDYKAWLEKSGLSPIDYWVENEIQVEDESLAVYNVRSIIGAIAEDLQVDTEDEIVVYLSGPDNYRNGIAQVKPYKGNRDPTRKPVHATALKQYIRNAYNCKVSDGQEADDDMGIAHFSMWEVDPDSTCIATIDKDLDTIPGMHYNFVTKESYLVSPEEASKFFWQQMVSGDPVDNIPGVPKWGKKKAADYVAKHWPDIVPAVRALYVQGYGEKADEVMLEMGRLLYIRRRPDEWWELPKEVSDAVSGE